MKRTTNIVISAALITTVAMGQQAPPRPAQPPAGCAKATTATKIIQIAAHIRLSFPGRLQKKLDRIAQTGVNVDTLSISLADIIRLPTPPPCPAPTPIETSAPAAQPEKETPPAETPTKTAPQESTPAPPPPAPDSNPVLAISDRTTPTAE